jgi:hypothetical protein
MREEKRYKKKISPGLRGGICEHGKKDKGGPPCHICSVSMELVMDG